MSTFYHLCSKLVNEIFVQIYPRTFTSPRLISICQIEPCEQMNAPMERNKSVWYIMQVAALII